MLRQLRIATIAACLIGFAASILTPAANGSGSSMLDMADQLDKLDKQDFQSAVDKAGLCTRKHDFACAESELNKAAKLANGSSDKAALNVARQNVTNEKARIAEAARQRAEEERRIAAAEQQRVADEQRRARAEQESKGGFQYGKAAALLGGATIGGLGKMSSDMQSKVITSIIKDSAEGQEGMNNLNAVTSTNSPSGSTSGSRATASTASTLAANKTNDESWKQCGPEKKCLVGDGYMQFCSGPYDPGKPMCKSECSMDSLVIYHDTTLKPGAYIPGNGKCPAKSCNVVNSCG